jgi:hypothetical protein
MIGIIGFYRDKRKTYHYCRFDYGTFKEYFCRPTNYVFRTMIVYCPSSGLQYYKEKESNGLTVYDHQNTLKE